MTRSEVIRGVALLCLITLGVGAAVFAGESRSVLGSAQAILASAMPLFPLCLGAALVIAVGEIDLSLSGAFSLYGMMLLLCASLGIPPVLSILGGLVFAALLGWSLGYLVSTRHIPSLVVTLAAAMILTGVALVIDYTLRGWSLESSRPSDVIALPSGRQLVTRTLPPEYLLRVFEYPIAWVSLLLVLVELWRRSLQGVRHVAVGMDRSAAVLASLPVDRIRHRAFLYSSVLCYVSSVLFIVGFQQGGWAPRAGDRLELVGIAAAVIGGTRPSGGALFPIGALLAIVLWESLAHLQVMIPGVGPSYQELVGGALLLAVALTSMRGHAAKWLRR